jgi:hypothetical protein
LFGVAVNVTELPAQKGFEDEIMDILTVRLGLTVIVTAGEVAGLFTAQVAFELTVQVTPSPFKGI